jgi:hypothetical protein
MKSGHYILIALFLFVLYNVYTRKKESFNTASEQGKHVMSNKIKAFLQKDTKYTEYLDFLVENKNTSYKLLKQETFYKLKDLLKQGELTDTALVSFMDDFE